MSSRGNSEGSLVLLLGGVVTGQTLANATPAESSSAVRQTPIVF